MTNLFHNAFGAALDVINDIAGEVVEYCTAEGRCSITAIHSPKNYNVIDTYGNPVAYQSDDWMCIRELVISGRPVTPRQGHKLRQPTYRADGTATGQVNVYEVNFVAGSNVFENTTGVDYRIHMKLIGTEAR